MDNKEILEDAKKRIIEENKVKEELRVAKIKKNPVKDETYVSFIEELKAAIVEGEFASRWELLRCYHEVGKMLIDFQSQRDVPITRIAEDLEAPKSAQHLQRCVLFYKKFPDLEKLPDGKAISWHKVVNKYLFKGTKVSKEKAVEVVDWIICPFCSAHFNPVTARKDKE
jgi:hypothetical protein